MGSEDAFRIIDTDYDRFINKKDLHQFLKTVLKIPHEELESSRIDRLFNLMDLYRRGQVAYEDFVRVQAEGSEPCDNQMVTGGRFSDKTSFDWKLKARQQIGYFISRKCKSLNDCFDIVAANTISITYAKFKDWIEQHNVQQGFNLTEKLVQELFSDIDPHKKGHLTENDWENAFGIFFC